MAIIISILTVVYLKETVFITAIYHYRTIPVSEKIIATVFLSPSRRYQQSGEYPPISQCSKFLTEPSKNSKKEFMKLSKSKATQRITKTNTSNLIVILSDL